MFFLIFNLLDNLFLIWLLILYFTLLGAEKCLQILKSVTSKPYVMYIDMSCMSLSDNSSPLFVAG